MSRAVLVKVTCDLCGEVDCYPIGSPTGWVQDERPWDGRIIDLCPTCTRDVAPLQPPPAPTPENPE